jgi:L-alanine-DL-glutamate epimerase-like enolase superfamily enzyme
MRLVSATLYALRIPFVEAFGHSASDRQACDSVVLRVRDEVGTEGFGEGAPRPYVTGESVETVLAHLAAELWPILAERELPIDIDLAGLDALVPDLRPPGVVAPHAARAALELAVLDCGLRRAGRPMATLLPPRHAGVTYSGVITAGPLDRTVRHAARMRAVGLRQVKLKVGFDDDVARVAAVRAALGPEASLRLDANGAWTLARAVEVLGAVAPLGIACVEQPLGRGADYPGLRAAVPVPLMADESLITLDDAETLVAGRAVDFFNVRVSKCGGLARSLAIATRALGAGLGVQVGSQVGETAVLAAAGRHLAAALPAVAFVEGSFGTLLLSEDVSVESVRFGHRGRAPVLTGPGLGIRVREEILRRHAVVVHELGKGR